MPEIPVMTLAKAAQDMLDVGMLEDKVKCTEVQIHRISEERIIVYFCRKGVKMFKVEFPFDVGKWIVIPDVNAIIDVEIEVEEDGR